jgi:hypothetical protein
LRPSELSPGRARDEVQRLTVSATGGSFVLREDRSGEYRLFPWNASAAQVQAGLEEIYGPGNVVVSGGPGDETAGTPYLISFQGGLAMQRLPLLDASASSSFLTCVGAVGPDCTAGATVTELSAGRPDGEIALSAINLGDGNAGGAAGAVRMADLLPPGATPVYVAASVGQSSSVPQCSLQPAGVSCELDGSLAPYDRIEVRIGVVLDPDSPPTEPNRFLISGGGASPAGLERSLSLAEDPGPFGIDEFGLRPEAPGGGAENQAGAHPFQVTTSFAFRQSADAQPLALPKEVRIDLPPGLVANSTALPVCPAARFFDKTCPLASVLGVATFTANDPSALGLTTPVSPVFNVAPSPGQSARFGLMPAGVPVFINASLRAGDGYAATLGISNITEAVGVLGGTVTLWGVPGDPRHDDARGFDCLLAARGDEGRTCQRLHDSAPRSFLTLPTACDGPPPSSTIAVSSWAAPSNFVSAGDPFPPLVGCNRPPFGPTVTVSPSSNSASSPSGLDFELDVDDEGLLAPAGLGASAIRRIELTLPEGVTLNAAAAGGLASCGRAAYEAEGAEPTSSGCPDASKLGGVEIESPILPEPLAGSLFLANQDDNPFGGLLAAYLVARNPALGLVVKLPARLRLDPLSGRVTVEFDELPELPISYLRLSLQQGPRSLFATPPVCGSFAGETRLTPYSDPDASLRRPSTYTVRAGPEGGPCPDPRAASFRPRLLAGTLDNAAGRYSTLYARITRGDSDPELSGFSLTLPAGLGARLAGVAYCGATDLAFAAGKTASGEAAEPSCPAASRIGSSRIGAGVGPLPSYLPGSVYLAGPYQGAPFSVAAVTPAALGPLDLGTVVLRFPLGIDPDTGRLTIDSGGGTPLPRIVSGIPLNLRDLRLNLDRPRFILNPTSCEPLSFGGTAAPPGGGEVPLSSRFQAADCAALPFRPRLGLSLSGGLGRNAHPRVEVELTQRPGGANLAAAAFTLPAGELLDTRRIGALCADEPATGGCPAASRLGHAVIRSPLLSQPLRGPVFLRAPSHRYPDLLAVLHSGQLSLRLHGTVGAAPGGRLRLRLERIPDLPVSRSTLSFAAGRRGIFVNSASLCGRSLHADAQLTAHNGRHLSLRPALRLNGRC